MPVGVQEVQPPSPRPGVDFHIVGLARRTAVGQAFGDKVPPISSTKALTGHSLGAAGVQEAIYSLLMLKHGFITGSANVTEKDEGRFTIYSG